MRALFIATIILALCAITVFAADPLCGKDDDCNTLASVNGTPMGCKDSKCFAKTAKDVKSEVKKATEYCKDSHRNNDECRYYGTVGCNSKEVWCVTDKDTTKEKCEKKKEEGKTPAAKEGDRCEGDKSEKDCVRGQDLFCHKDFKICVKKGKVGEPCVKGECVENAVCHYGTCIPRATVGDFQYAEKDDACESGKLEDGICVPTYAQKSYRQQCHSNSDCEKHELCDADAKTCIGISQHADREYDICKGQNCVGDENDKDCSTSTSKCQAAKIKSFCAEECVEEVQSRKPLEINDDYYAVDCSALTMTKLEDNKCDIKPAELVRNCEAAFKSFRASSASTLSGNNVVMVAMALSALIALIF